MFDASEFAEEFNRTIDWMCDNGLSLEGFKKNRDGLSQDPNYIPAFSLLIELFVTQSWYYQKPKNFDEKMRSFVSRQGTQFLTAEAQSDLLNWVEELAPVRRVANRARQKLPLLTRYASLREFSVKLHSLAKEGRTQLLGEKGRDSFLRDFGFWDRIPIDRHEMRFLIRTGIYHTSSYVRNSDPLERNCFHDALTEFCSTYLSGKVVEGIDLGSAPGIVDIFIWSYCARSSNPDDITFNICGKTPQCGKCTLRGQCLYALLSDEVKSQQFLISH